MDMENFLWVCILFQITWCVSFLALHTQYKLSADIQIFLFMIYSSGNTVTAE